MEEMAAPLKPECRQTEMAEDKAIVQHDIDNCFRQGAIDQEFALVGADQQGVAHLVDI